MKKRGWWMGLGVYSIYRGRMYIVYMVLSGVYIIYM